jgi:hypothetical protein
MLKETRTMDGFLWNVVLTVVITALVVVAFLSIFDQGGITASGVTSELGELIGVIPDRIFMPGVTGERLAMAPESIVLVPAMSHADKLEPARLESLAEYYGFGVPAMSYADSLEAARFDALAKYFGFGVPEMSHAMQLDGARLMAIAEYYLAKDQ